MYFKFYVGRYVVGYFAHAVVHEVAYAVAHDSRDCSLCHLVRPFLTTDF